MIRRAEKLERQGRYADAIKNYREALAQDSLSRYALFGLGNALLNSGQREDALKEYDKLKENPQLDREQRHDLFHNIGNAYYREKKYQEAIEVYKESLRMDPEDDDTRYNLVMAQKLLEQQKQQQKQDNKQQDNNKDQNDQKQLQNQDPKQDKQNPKQDPKDKNQSPPPPEGDATQMNREQAEKMLEVFKQDDQRTRERLMKQEQARKAKGDDKNKKRW